MPLTQTSPAPQLVPLPEVDHAVVDAVGVQTWQAFAGFVAPAAYVAPPMSHSETQPPLTQISPAPQLVPVAALDHALVDAPAVHTWQAFAGFVTPEAKAAPPM